MSFWFNVEYALPVGVSFWTIICVGYDKIIY